MNNFESQLIHSQCIDTHRCVLIRHSQCIDTHRCMRIMQICHYISSHQLSGNLFPLGNRTQKLRFTTRSCCNNLHSYIGLCVVPRNTMYPSNVVPVLGQLCRRCVRISAMSLFLVYLLYYGDRTEKKLVVFFVDQIWVSGLYCIRNAFLIVLNIALINFLKFKFVIFLIYLNWSCIITSAVIWSCASLRDPQLQMTANDFAFWNSSPNVH